VGCPCNIVKSACGERAFNGFVQINRSIVGPIKSVREIYVEEFRQPDGKPRIWYDYTSKGNANPGYAPPAAARAGSWISVRLIHQISSFKNSRGCADLFAAKLRFAGHVELSSSRLCRRLNQTVATPLKFRFRQLLAAA
jgi:hypothetical protein